MIMAAGCTSSEIEFAGCDRKQYNFPVKDQEVQLFVDQHMVMTKSLKDSALTTFNILVKG